MSGSAKRLLPSKIELSGVLFFILASSLSGCGGGGGGSGGEGSAPAPCIVAQKIDFPTGSVPAGFNTGTIVIVLDNSCSNIVTNASVTVNGVPLPYNAANQDYEANVVVAAGGAVNLNVNVGGVNYTASGTQFTAYPTISAPTGGATWSSLLSNLIGWSGGAPTTKAIYGIGVLDAADPNGPLVWPASNLFDLESPTAISLTIPPNSLTAGNRLVAVGVVTDLDIPGAAPGSGLAIGGFSYVPITVVDSIAAACPSIAVIPPTVYVTKGAAKQLTANCILPGATLDITAQVTWTSSDATKVTVSATGLATAVDFGSATITAGAGNVSGSATVNAVPPTSIAVAPPAQSILKGATRQLTATGAFPDNSTQDVTSVVAWTSSDPTKVTVSATGLVTAVDFGSATVTAVSGGTFGSASVTVFQPNPSPSPPLSQSVGYRIDYAHSGRAAFGASISFPGTSAWSVTLNGTVSYPIIADGKVFVTTAGGGNPYGTTLYALDEQTGNAVWGPVFISGTFLWSGHAYDHGTLFVVNNDGLLRSFDGATGQAGWSTQLPGQSFFNSPPTAVNGLVYVGGAGVGGTLYAVDESNGNVLWTAFVANGDTSSPTVSNDGVFVSYPCQFYKFDPLTGSALWHDSGGCEGGGGSTSVFANGLLYVREEVNPGESPVVHVLDAATGTQIGTLDAPLSTWIPAISTQSGFLNRAGTLQGIDLSTRNTLWSFAGDGKLVSAPIVIDQFVVVGSSSGNVYAVDATTGSQVWSQSAGGAISAPGEGSVSQPVTGFGAGEGYLVVPAGDVLTAWHLTGP